MSNRKDGFTKPYIVFLLFFYTMISRDWLEGFIPAFRYADELLAATSLIYYLRNLIKNRLKIVINKHFECGIFIALFVITGVLGNAVYSYQPFLNAALPDMFLCVKFWLCIYVGRFLLQGFDVEIYAKRIYSHLRFIVWLYTILFMINNLFGMFPSTIRYGLRSTQLFYSHPTVFAAEGVFVLAILMMINKYVKGCKKYMILISLLICSTLRSKAIAAVFAFGLVYYLVVVRKKPISIRTIILLVPLCILLGWDQIQYYFFSSIQSDSARYQLLRASIDISLDHFPIGSGFGTFASYYSGKIYSPLYEKYNLSNVNGLIKGASNFVSDSFWPTVLGQSGVIGLFCYCIALLLLFFKIQKLRKYNVSFYLAAMFMFVYEIIVSAAEAAFFHPISIQYAVLLGYMLSLQEKSDNDISLKISERR